MIALQSRFQIKGNFPTESRNKHSEPLKVQLKVIRLPAEYVQHNCTFLAIPRQILVNTHLFTNKALLFQQG